MKARARAGTSGRTRRHAQPAEGRPTVKRREAVGGLALLAGSAAAGTGMTSRGQTMSDVDVLTAIRDIMTLKALYFRFVDTRRWDEFAALFAPDATLFFPEGQERPANVVDSLAFIKTVLQGT